MYSGANVYGWLLVFAFVVGAALGAIYDVTEAIRDWLLLLFKKHYKTAIKSGTKTTNDLIDDALKDFGETEQNGGILLTRQCSGMLKLAMTQVRRPRIFEMMLNAALDICFWAVVTVSLILLVFQLNFGELRAFVPAVILLGALIYRKTLGVPMRALGRAAVFILWRCLRTVIGVLRVPFSFVFGLCAGVFLRLGCAFKRRSEMRTARRRRRAYARREIALAERGMGIKKDMIR